MVLNSTSSSSRPILEIDLNNLVYNYKLAQQLASYSKVSCVVKANAYGLGAVQVSKALYQAGCRDFYVAYLEEAMQIAPNLDQSNIYILSSNTTDELSESVKLGFIPVLNTTDAVSRYKKLGDHLSCVVNFDTGMTRAGLNMSDADMLDVVGLDVRYIVSHLACADEPDHPLNAEQLSYVKRLQAQFQNIPISFANSSGIFLGKDYLFNQVRPGSMLYGINPTPHTINPMKHVATIKAKVLQIRTLDKARTVSYGAKYLAADGAKIATIGCGYADGYHRFASFNSNCYFQGIELPIVGTITMDMMMVDVSKLSDDLLAKLDYVELLNHHFTVDDLAKKAKTIGYEVLTSLGNRFNRIYK